MAWENKHEQSVSIDGAARQNGFSRRQFLKAVGAALLGTVIAAPYVDKIDKILSHERWPADEIEIIPAIGSETLDKGGEEWLVFGGFGQKYSINAAQELYNAIGQNQVVSSLKYPNQGFTIDELADQVGCYISNRQMKALNIVGVSMGLPTALMTLRTVQRQFVAADANNAYQDGERHLPTINYLAAYSSPADLRDAIDGDLAPWIDKLSRLTGYEPGVIAKFVFSATDGQGDVERLLNVLNRDQWYRHMRNSIEQTFNECPPQLVMSQIQVISSYNVESQWHDLQGVVSPVSTKFVYCSPSNYDRTVDNATAIRKYQSALTQLSVPTTILDTGPSGHANTYASAAALGSLVIATQMHQ
jgi:hypothetical protein